MTVLVVGANGRTGRHVIAALRALDKPPPIRGLLRTAHELPVGVEPAYADMEDKSAVGRALDGVDTVIHYGPTMHPRETAMGTGMIDAAKAAGVRRFVFVSVIHPEIDDLVNHKTKLAIESYLINSRLDWTVLRPQHYMQTIDVRRAVTAGRLTLAWPPDVRHGHVDMRDLAEAAAIVATRPGHSYATYDIDGGAHLSTREICAIISRLSGSAVEPGEIDATTAVQMVTGRPGEEQVSDYTVEGYHRMLGYYSRMGTVGNPNVATWLLGRAPASFEDYVRRSLAGSDAGSAHAGASEH
jgi:uncharacterized protein YbjT (DUF2867 family)